MKAATIFTSNIWLMFFYTVSGKMGEEEKIYFGYFNSQGLEPAGAILPLTANTLSTKTGTSLLTCSVTIGTYHTHGALWLLSHKNL